MNMRRRILIIRLSSLGDLLHALPAFQDLRTAFPEAEIDWLVEKRFAFLLSAVPGISAVLGIDLGAAGKTPWDFSVWRDVGQTIRKMRERNYDISIDFQGLVKTGLLSLLGGAKTRIGFSPELVRERPAAWFYSQAVGNAKAQAHVIHLNRLLAQAAGAGESKAAFLLKTRDEDSRIVCSLLRDRQLSDFIIINPGGGWVTKTWKPSRYGKLAARIQDELGIPVVVTTGPGEENLFQEISGHCISRPHHFQVSFLQLIPLLRKARLLVGGDTGPFHLACALGVPVVGIFGPTHPARNGPWRDKDEVVVHVLPCSFCYGRKCPTMNECMDIPVAEVFAAIERRVRSGT